MNTIKSIIASGIFLLTFLIPAQNFAQSGSKGKVLVVLTTTKILQLQDGKTYDGAGYYLDELTYPLQKIIAAGYQPVFATINGEKPYPAPFSEDKMFFNNSGEEVAEAKALIKKFDKELQQPERLSVVAQKTSEYVGILVPGGFGPMQDLVVDENLGNILTVFHQEGKPTGMICHGPVTLISTLPDAKAFIAAMTKGDYTKANELAQGWIYKGYRLTVFSSGEELQLHQLNGKVLYYVSHALSQAGAHVDYLAQGQSNVIEDRELVTGQQPFSAPEFADVFVAKLNAYKSK